MIVCREDDDYTFNASKNLDDPETAICTKAERDFLKALLGGCSTPISALAEIREEQLIFHGNMVSPDGKLKAEVKMNCSIVDALVVGEIAAKQILKSGGQAIAESIRFVKN